MKTTDITARLAGLGGAKWEVYAKAKDMRAAGKDIIDLTIGEPDVPTPTVMIDVAEAAMRKGRTTYSNGRGEPGLLNALSEKYTKSAGRPIGPEHVMCFPGTQTALFSVMMGVAQTGDDVLVGDPMYATYEGVIRATGAAMVPVPLRSENGFRIHADDIKTRITPKTAAILLTSPHNPTGAVLNKSDLEAIAELALAHDFWIISDEVYEDLMYEESDFTSPLGMPEIADRVIVVSSISKSHAAPGFRSGWCVGPEDFTKALLPFSETMLFGSQPFIADMTEMAIREVTEVAQGMRQRFAARARYLSQNLQRETALKIHQPKAGMFALIDVSSTGLNGYDFAMDLLEKAHVSVMPGTSFGTTLNNWVRVALTVEDADFETACARIIAHVNKM